jgi:hypothetical protein
MQQINTKNFGLITMMIFIVFVFNIVMLWFTFLPQMEVAGEETSELISGEGAATQIINLEMIPEVRMFFILSLVIFGLLDGIFALILWKGKPNPHNTSVIIPLFATYIGSRVFNVLIVWLFPIAIIVGTNPRFMMNILYLSAVVLVVLSLVIILIFQMKVFSESKRTATKVLEGPSEEITQ